jgi:hypothetical protein
MTKFLGLASWASGSLATALFAMTLMAGGVNVAETPQPTLEEEAIAGLCITRDPCGGSCRLLIFTGCGTGVLTFCTCNQA